MSSAVEIKVLPEEEIPEVLEYREAQAALDNFEHEHVEVLQEYHQLIGQRDTAHQAADKAVRIKGVNCGPWRQMSPVVSYDGEELYNSIGRDGFLSVGGTINVVSQYNIDKKTVEAAIATNKIPQPVIEKIRKVVRKWHAVSKG